MRLKPGKISLYFVCLLGLIAFILRLWSPEWTPETGTVLSWDVLGYYLYLPGEFLFDDLSQLQFVPELMETYQNSATFYQVEHFGDVKVIKYTMGMAIGYLPFFLIGHAFASAGDFATDGFSAPYQISIAIGCVVYLFIGLLLMRKVLLRYFSEKWTIVLLFLLFFGTNYLQFGVWKGAMPHSLLFTLYAALIWLTIRWHEAPNWKKAVGIGLCLGLLSLIRPTEIIAVLIPLLWNLHNKASFQQKWKLIKSNGWHFLWIALAFFIVWTPQFFYWKSLTGDWLHYTYGNEAFYFSRPQIMNVLFSFKKGWLLYTPMMGLSIVGMVVLWKKKRELFWVIAVFFLVNLFLISSWSNWWYASSFGHRAFIQSYGLMLIPLGFLLQAVWEKLGKTGKILMVVPTFFVLLNLFQLWQFHSGIIHPHRMTGPYYKAVFGQTSIPEGAYDFLSPELFFNPTDEYMRIPGDYESSLAGVQSYEKETVAAHFHADLSEELKYGGRSSFYFNEQREYGPAITQEIDSLRGNNETWVRSTVYFFAEENAKLNDVYLTIHFKSMGKEFKYRSIPFDSVWWAPDKWNAISIEALLPESRYADDIVETFVWNKAKTPLYVDELRMDVLVKKPKDQTRNFTTLRHLHFEPETESGIHLQADTFVAHSGKQAHHNDPTRKYTPAIVVPVAELSEGKPLKIRTMAHVYYEENIAAEDILLVASFEKDGEVFSYHRLAQSWQLPLKNWYTLKLDVDIPENLPEGAVLKTYLLNQGNRNFWLDDCVVQQLFSKPSQ